MIEKLRQKYSSFPKQVKASIWFLVCSFLQKGISFITTPIFTRLLSTDDYGAFSVYNSWMSIITIFATLNLHAGVYSQGLIKFDKEREVFSSSLQGLTLCLVSVWTAVYLMGRSFWNEIFSLTTVQMLAMIVTIWANAVFGFWAAEQRVKLNYKSMVIITLAVSVIQPAVGILFVSLAEDKVTARILGIALVNLIAYALLFVVQVRRGKKLFSKKFWKYALAFNLPLVPHYLSQTILNSADRIMIESMVGQSEAGIYSLAYSIANIMVLFNTALLQTLNPWIYQKIKDRKEKDIAGVAYAALTIIAGVNILLIAFAPEVVAIFAPEKYHDAIWVIPPVAMSVYFMFAYSLFANFEFYYQKTHFVMLASIIGAILNIVLNYIFIDMFGYVAAGYTTLFCYITYAMGHYYFMQKVCKEYMDGVQVYNVGILLGISGVFLVCGFVLLATYRCTVVRYGVIAMFIVLLVVTRKKIMLVVNQLMSVRSKKN